MNQQTPEKPLLSLIIVNQPQLPDRHLELLIANLNAQQPQWFNTFWVEQGLDARPLQQLLQQSAHFPWKLLHPGQHHPQLGEVICWELTSSFAEIIADPEIAPFYSYLHKECLPDSQLMHVLAIHLPTLSARYGDDFICALHQLRSPLQLHELPFQHSLPLLEQTGGDVWKARLPYALYRQQHPDVWEAPWEEDAFVIPTALARRLELYSAVACPLYFQDMFNILAWLPEKPYCQSVHWLRLRDAVIYHLQHPRHFQEYSREFLDQVREKPEVFGHLALYDMAHSLYGYHEPFQAGKRQEAPGMLNFFYGVVLKSERGTLGLWSLFLDAMQFCPQADLPCLTLQADVHLACTDLLSDTSQQAINAWQQLFQQQTDSVSCLVEQEGLRLWLSLQQELRTHCQLHYHSPYYKKLFTHFRDYPWQASLQAMVP